MARQPDSPFATFDIDPETWSVQWFEEMEEKCRSFLGVEIHALPQVGDEVSVVAISTSVPPPGRGLCLIAESLTTSTASRLTDALAMLKNRQGLDAKQGLAFLVQLYLVHFDFLRATRGDGLELQSRRLHDVFKSRPEAWGELLIPGKSRGIYRLNR